MRRPVAPTGCRFEVASLVPHWSLDFANTLENRLTDRIVERLNRYGDLVAVVPSTSRAVLLPRRDTDHGCRYETSAHRE